MSEHREYTLPTPIDSEDEKLDNKTRIESSEQVEKRISELVENKIPFHVHDILIKSPNELLDEMKEPLVKEEIAHDTALDDVRTLVKVLRMVLNHTDSLDKYSFVITPDIRIILDKLIEHDTYFDEFELVLKEIIKDGKIDAKDVPRIMILLSDLYVRSQIMNVPFDENTCGYILKIIFNIAVKEGLIKINDDELALMKCVYNIIEMSVKLLQMGKESTPPRSGIFDCICIPLFGGK